MKQFIYKMIVTFVYNTDIIMRSKSSCFNRKYPFQYITF
ncbi:hypothetical protein bcere0030_54990 [Bacillus cereus AH1273]|nr:hypothetical protein bcere0030_54990 [Bacillus cereus AH1273]